MTTPAETEFDHTVLDRIDGSAGGMLPATPAYQDALRRLYAARQVYPNADQKGGHVTARSLVGKATFRAQNFEGFLAGSVAEDAIESNDAVYSRYVASLPAGLQPRAESLRVGVIGKPVLHRHREGKSAIHDPLHLIFLVPGAGYHPGLPGNYLHASVFHIGDADTGSWQVHIHDSEDGVAHFGSGDLRETLAKMDEVCASAPFHLEEIEALGFRAG